MVYYFAAARAAIDKVSQNKQLVVFCKTNFVKKRFERERTPVDVGNSQLPSAIFWTCNLNKRRID